MASRTREHRIIQMVACPKCGAGPGAACIVLSGPGIGLPASTRSRHGVRLVVHDLRRETWQRLREVTPEPGH